MMDGLKIKKIMDELDKSGSPIKNKIEYMESLLKAGVISNSESKEILNYLRKAAEEGCVVGEVKLIKLDAIKRKCWICGRETEQQAKYIFEKLGGGALLASALGGVVVGTLYAIVNERRNQQFTPRKKYYIYTCHNCKFSTFASYAEEIEIDKRNDRRFDGFRGKKKERETVRIIDPDTRL
jgi:hypothetical protein